MERTVEEIAQTYKAALDSVAVVNSTKPAGISAAEFADNIQRNKDHLAIVLAYDFWTTEDLAPLKAAVK